MLRSAGYQRNRYGFWTPDALGIKPDAATPDDDDNEENDQ